ncbi:MAG TPA: hypothetical protein VFZ61_05730, partial [Polyangiales bacterium]
MEASAARAQDTARVVVQSFRGPSGNVARAQVLGALKNQSEIEVVRSDAFEGLSGSALQDAAAEAEVSAVIEGRVRKKGKLLEVTVSVRDMSSGDVLHDQDWTRKKQKLNEIRDNFWTLMGPGTAAPGCRRCASAPAPRSASARPAR